jgi:hypothetical protein
MHHISESIILPRDSSELSLDDTTVLKSPRDNAFAWEKSHRRGLQSTSSKHSDQRYQHRHSHNYYLGRFLDGESIG